MQTGDSEQVKSAGLLKRLFNVFTRLMSEPEHDSAEKTSNLGCVFQVAAKRVLHPGPGLLCQPQDRIPTAVSNEYRVLRIANKQQSANVTTRQIGAHVEFAGISRRRDWLRGSRKLQFIAKFRRTAPTYLPDCVCRVFSAFELD